LRHTPNSRSALKGKSHAATVVVGGVSVVTVKVTFCGALLALEKATVAGRKVHCVLTGRPEHAISTPPTYPLIGAIAKVPLTEPGAETDNVPGGFNTSYCWLRIEIAIAVEEEGAKPESPVYIAVIV